VGSLIFTGLERDASLLKKIIHLMARSVVSLHMMDSPSDSTPIQPRVWLANTLCLLVLFVHGFVGCSAGPGTISPLYDRLTGRGPVVLADSNPYLPADAFYAEQRNASPALARYIQAHGDPVAISVERKLFKSTKIGFYYPRENRLVLFTRWGADWEAGEPQPISEEDKSIIAIQRAQAGEPADAPPVAQASKPSGDRQHVAAAAVGGGELRGRLKPPEPAEEARLVRLPNGDYQHRVTFQGETLRLLADWYTENPANETALAAAHRRAASRPLRQGDVVTIPKKLMRNVNPLPEAALP